MSVSSVWFRARLTPLVLAGCCGLGPSAEAQSRALEPKTALVDDKRIDRIDEDDPGAWLAYGRGYDEHRFSP